MAVDGHLNFDTKIDESGFNDGISKLSGLAKTGVAAVGKALAGVTAALGAGAVAGRLADGRRRRGAVGCPLCPTGHGVCGVDARPASRRTANGGRRQREGCGARLLSLSRCQHPAAEVAPPTGSTTDMVYFKILSYYFNCNDY